MRLGLALLLMAAGWGLYRWWFPSDETQVKALIRAAAEAASWRVDSGGLEKLAGANRLAACCTPEVEIVLDTGGRAPRAIRGTEELRQAVLAARTSGASLEVELGEVEVKIPAGATAGTAQFLATARVNDVPDPILQEIRVLVKKTEGGWRIARVEPVRGFGM